MEKSSLEHSTTRQKLKSDNCKMNVLYNMENWMKQFLMANPALDNNYDFNFQASRQPPKVTVYILGQ